MELSQQNNSLIQDNTNISTFNNDMTRNLNLLEPPKLHIINPYIFIYKCPTLSF